MTVASSGTAPSRAPGAARHAGHLAGAYVFGGRTTTTPSLAMRAISTERSTTAGRRGRHPAFGPPKRPPRSDDDRQTPATPAIPGEGSTVRPAWPTDLLAESNFFAGATGAGEGHGRRSGLPVVRGDVCSTRATRDGLFLVLDGRLASSSPTRSTAESVVALMEHGDCSARWPARQATALGDGQGARPSTVLAIPYAPVEAMFRDDPQLLWGVTRLLAGRLRSMDAALADSVFLDVTGRTAKRLLEMSDGTDSFTLPVTQEELAGIVGASRERVNKAIASFIRLGWPTSTTVHDSQSEAWRSAAAGPQRAWLQASRRTVWRTEAEQGETTALKQSPPATR
jgi:hypothetical protein